MITWPPFDVLLQGSVDSARAIGHSGTTTRALLGVCACRFLASRDERLDRMWPRDFSSYYSSDSVAALFRLAHAIEKAHPRLLEVLTRHLLSIPPEQESLLAQCILRLTDVEDIEPRDFELWFDQTCDAVAGPGVGGLQFSTPRPLADLMIRLIAPTAGEDVHDPCAGFGSLLAAVGRLGPAHFKSLSGQEIDPGIAALAQLRLYLIGAKNIRIKSGDVLRQPLFTAASERGSSRLETFDVVVCDPPYGQRLGSNDFALRDPLGRFPHGSPGRTASDMAFLQHTLASLKPNGRAIALISHGPLLRGGADVNVRAGMLRDNAVEAVIGLPSGLLPGLAIEPALLILRGRDATMKNRDRRVLFIDCSRQKEALATPETWQAFTDQLVSTYKHGRASTNPAHNACFAEVIDASFSLQPRRYVTRQNQTPEVDVLAALNEATALEHAALEQASIMERLLQRVC